MQNHLRTGAAVLAFIFSGISFAQSTPATSPAAPASPTFDVATIKPSAPIDQAKMLADLRAGQMPKIGPRVEGLLAEYNYMALRDLIALAYDMKGYQVSGPDWLATTRFDIEARLPQGSSKDDAPAMLRSLLQDRFKLVAHRTTAEHPVFALIVGKNGPKLQAATGTPPPLDLNAPLQSGESIINTADGPARLHMGANGNVTVNMGTRGIITQRVDVANGTVHMESSSVTMSGFADMLTRMMQMGGGGDRQVVDQTGIKGNYQVSFDLSLSELLALARSRGIDLPTPGGNGGAFAASTPTNGSSIFESVDQLGLKLEPRKAQVEELVVDSVEKTPTAN